MTQHVRLTDDGRAAIPADVLAALEVSPGETIAFEREGDAWIVRKGDPAEAFRQRLERARRLSRPLPRQMSTDEYMAMVREPVPLDPDA